MNKQKSYHHPPTNPNYFSHTNYFFSVQLGHPKLSGYGLLSTQALQNRSQKYSSVSQSGATAFPWRDPGPPAASRRKGDKAGAPFLQPHLATHTSLAEFYIFQFSACSKQDATFLSQGRQPGFQAG